MRNDNTSLAVRTRARHIRVAPDVRNAHELMGLRADRDVHSNESRPVQLANITPR